MAIIYSYPTVTPESEDLIVGTDITGKVTKNFTVGSIVSTEIPTYITGTTNSVPLFTSANTIGDSIINQNASADKVFIGGELDVSGGDGISLDENAFLSIQDDKFLVGDWDGNALSLGLYDETSTEILTIENGSVGIGTTSPTRTLDVNGEIGVKGEMVISSSSGFLDIGQYLATSVSKGLKFYADETLAMTIDTATNVGIGTSAPSSKLDVNGNIAATNLTVTGDVTGDKFISSSNSARFVQPSATSYLNHLKVDSTLGSTFSPGVYGWQFEYDTPHASGVTFRFDNDHYKIYSGATGVGEIVRFTDTGNIGIGTTSPNNKLEVAGTIRITESNFLSFGGAGSIPEWSIRAYNPGLQSNDLVIEDIASTFAAVKFENGKGVVLPNKTTTEINAIGGPDEGAMIYNTTLNTICFYNGSAWQKVSHTAM